MREPHVVYRFGCLDVGITPAHAGTTPNYGNEYIVTRDHPRSCGNHFLSEKIVLPILGSPPLMREPRTMLKALSEVVRITPAHAGTTFHLEIYSALY